MKQAGYRADDYVQKQQNVEKAIGLIRSGQRTLPIKPAIRA